MDLAIITLSLHGFTLLLPQLRRAWLYRDKLAGPPLLRSSARPAANPLDAPVSGVSHLLLQTLVCAGSAIEGFDDDRTIVSVLKIALKRLGLDGGGSDAGPARQLWQMVAMFAARMESGTLVRDASDREMVDAQRHLCAGMALLESCRQDQWSPDVSERIAHRAFILILALLRSGQDAVVETVSARIRAASLQPGSGPAEAIYARA